MAAEGVAAVALVAAVAILVPPGVGRRTMIAGSALLLVQHAAHMLWLLGPRVSGAALSLSGAAVLVGLAVWLAMLAWPGVEVMPRHIWAVLWFGLMGATMLGLLGLITSSWAEKFDHAAAVGNFVVAPLSLLSGTFYSVDSLSPLFQAVSHANPFFYIISGFRYGFLGAADSPVMLGAALLLGINVALGALCYALLRSGWKLKA